MANAPNPYQPPHAHAPATPRAGESHLASLFARLFGRAVDALIAVFPVVFLYLTEGRVLLREMSAHPGIEFYFYTGALGQGCFGADIVIAVIQALLISTRGQSIGKVLVHTRIVAVGGAPAGFVRGWLLRTGVLAAIFIELPILVEGIGGSIVGALWLLDAFFIFLPARRCLHDWFAGTEVLDVR
jgi:uncharacterized RDD family membrane protein YckC